MNLFPIILLDVIEVLTTVISDDGGGVEVDEVDEDRLHLSLQPEISRGELLPKSIDGYDFSIASDPPVEELDGRL